MINAEKALEILTNVVRYKLKHRDYDHVVKYAKLFKTFVTGEGANELLKNFVPREDDTMLEQRKRLTHHIVKPCAAAPLRPLNKLPRVAPSVNVITYPTPDKAKEDAVRKAMSEYYGGQSIDVYLEKYFPILNGYDPNSFFLTLFNNFDHRYQKPIPYTTEVSAEMAIDFQYFNNTLQYLVVCTGIKYDLMAGSDSKQPGSMYQIYVDNDAVEFVQVDALAYPGIALNVVQARTALVGPNKGNEVKIIKFEGERVFEVNTYNTKSGIVPAVRVGCIPDPETDGRTCVGILDNAKPYFLKTIKTVSELDLTMTLHAFPQKVIYVPRCVGTAEAPCKAGYTPDGSVCKVCNGTKKVPAHTSAQDTVEIELPDERNLDKIFDLSRLVHYVTLPIDDMKFQSEFVDKLQEKIVRSIYNSDIFIKDTIADTATKDNIEMESVYDTLNPFATHYGVCRSHVTTVSANYLDLGAEIIVQYSFSKDFKFKPVTMLLSELKAANESGAPSYIIGEIVNDIRARMFEDRPEELKKLKVKDNFFPFSGKTNEEIQFISGQKTTPRAKIVLWSNFEDIFIDLEKQSQENGVNFYDIEYKKQKELIDAAVEKIMNEMSDEQTITIPFPRGEPETGGQGGESPDNPNPDENANKNSAQ